jgi:DNA-binding NarL/FixJ family response regulator
MKIDNPIHNTSFTPNVPATSSEASAAPSVSSGADFADVLEKTKSAELPATRMTKSGDTLIGIVRDEAKAKGITLSGSQEFKLAMSLAAHNGIANPNQIATGRTLQTDKLGAMLQDLPSLNTALAQNNNTKSALAPSSMPAAQALQTNKNIQATRPQAVRTPAVSQHPVLAQTLDRAVARGFIPGNEKQDVFNKILQVANKHKFSPDDFARLTLMESDGMNPQATNQRCHGIIQFCDGPARGAAGVGFGEKPKAILGLSVYQQLHLVDAYFENVGLPKAGAVPLDELYLAVLQPAARNETRSEAPLGIPGKQALKLYEGNDAQAPITRNSIIQGLMQNAVDRLNTNNNSPRNRIQSQKTAEYEANDPSRVWKR